MDLSGIIFVVLALAWAVFLIPKALKHHDEIARTRSIDRFSTAMRVLARREPVNRRDSRLVVTPRPAGSPRMLVPSPAAAAVAAVEASAQAAESGAVRRAAARPRSGQAAARAAAKRRRRILMFLVAVDLIVVGVAAVGLVPWWAVTVPVASTVGYLFLCRRQVRRERTAVRSRTDAVPAGASADIAPRRAIRVEAQYGTPRSSGNRQALAEADPAAARAVPVRTTAVAVATVDGGSLWDPLPVTLPTYVSKPRASRTVRTIDLREPGTWTSGRSEADSKLVEEAAAAHDAAAGREHRRAVGS